jgi:hypothetical protein
MANTAYQAPTHQINLLHSSVQTVTPAQAATWLKNQKTNRPINNRFVEYLKGEILAGSWRTIHQGIAFDLDGQLVDGQHRLAAIVAAGQPVNVMVTFGVQAKDVRDAVDQGKPRSRAQLFAMSGEKYSAK